MKTSTEFNSTANKVGYEKAVELLAKAGFDCWDFSLFHMCRYDWGKRCPVKTGDPLEERDTALRLAEKLGKTGKSFGIECNQSHAPFPVSEPAILEFVPLALECTAVAGGKICIVHPDNNKTAEQNAVMYRELLPYAKQFGVKIATENMWNWYNDERNCAAPAACSSPEDFCRHVDAVSDPFLGACLDIGHAEMMGESVSAEGMVRALGDRLIALHVHDNNRHNDNHQLPGTMNIDYGPITKALKDTGYRGEMTLEADSYLSGVTAENIEEHLRIMADTARKLANDVIS